MSRCCCGKITGLSDEDFPVQYNDTVHELLGPRDNFCGPFKDHEIKLLTKELHASMAECAKLKVELDTCNMAYEQQRKTIFDLTEKVIPTFREQMYRLEDEVEYLKRQVKKSEIKARLNNDRY